MATDVVVPTLGESITEATLGQWLKKPGEAVKADEPIASLETDKVSVEVPAPTAGVIAELVVGEGDTVNVGAVIARIDAGATASTAATPAVEDRNAIGQAEAAAPAEPAAAPVEEAGDPVTLSPSVRRAVLEHGVDPSKIKGTGKDGRLTKDDVIAEAKTQPKP
ncbi:biotin/lipoyl-containing protein, partial [Rhizorhabdus histidinilytica]|uniref:biotin/lipoyl-containing protein n=1 Tax=Rhizorhabdus histidinilytica TaxID=439228 RepID=UPI0035E4D32D